MEISTASELMRVEGKTLEELQDQIAPKTFHILEAYLRSECPRESHFSAQLRSLAMDVRYA